MEALVLDGKRYVKASRAARLAGYTSDYVGQLCRSGKIKAKLVGRSWYVDEEELREYRSETKRTSRRKAREQVKETARHIAISDDRDLPHRSSNFERRAQERRISYAEDSSELIPELKKITVDSDSPKRPAADTDDTDEPAYEIENEGQKVVMSGEIEVEDASDDMSDPDTVLLEPEIISGEDQPPKKTEKPAESERNERQKPAAAVPRDAEHAHTAGTKATAGRSEDSVERIELEVVSADDVPPVARGHHSRYISVLLIVIAIIASAAFVFLNGVWTFTQSDGEGNSFSVDSRYDVEDIVQLSEKYFK